mmetsp:Transcript_63880/g.152348  ORF Transcript_63880/g.152348 Transcript_63880/m.152348 type:complete len:267 (-) Transcript_63880:155-955(-)
MCAQYAHHIAKAGEVRLQNWKSLETKLADATYNQEALRILLGKDLQARGERLHLALWFAALLGLLGPSSWGLCQLCGYLWLRRKLCRNHRLESRRDHRNRNRKIIESGTGLRWHCCHTWCLTSGAACTLLQLLQGGQKKLPCCSYLSPRLLNAIGNSLPPLALCCIRCSLQPLRHTSILVRLVENTEREANPFRIIQMRHQVQNSALPFAVSGWDRQVDRINKAFMTRIDFVGGEARLWHLELFQSWRRHKGGAGVIVVAVGHLAC